ncbi:nuclear protein MDM1 [Gastrophryne carolinensis]
MPARSKVQRALSEYDRSFKWRTSYEASKSPSRWAGLRSDELGITKEPSFPSKRRVAYYRPQVSKSFQWKDDDDLAEGRRLGRDVVKQSLIEEKIMTPDAPRLEKKTRSKSAMPRMETNTEHRAAPKIQSAEDQSEVPRVQPAKGIEPGLSLRNNENNNKKMAEMKTAGHQEETNGIHRVLKKKAGMNIAASHHPLRVSEYRRQFERKNPTDNSPLLAAEQVIHNKNQSVPPFRLINVNAETEYESQFKGSSPPKGPKLRKDWEDKHITHYDQENHSPKRKEKKKSNSEGKSETAKADTSNTKHKEIDQRTVKENFVKQIYTPKYYRNAKTEYSSNFLSPLQYKYKNGAWVKTKHLVQDQDSHLSLGSMWVAEVKELREKAKYYRHRAEGTHFSRNHLNQIMSTNNKFWDVSSTSSSEDDVSNNIKALDLAGLQTSSRNEIRNQPPARAEAPFRNGNDGVSNVSPLPVRRKLVWDDPQDTETAKEVTPLGLDEEPEEAADAEDGDKAEKNTEEKYYNNIKEAASQSKTKSNSSDDDSECHSTSSGHEGRLPTPKLKTYGLPQRTHHDLTTPATGGALLVSPPKSREPTPEHRHKHLESKKIHGSPKKTFTKDLPQQIVKMSQSPPVAGLRTIDPLPLREDPWPSPQSSNKFSPTSITYPVSRPVDKPYVPQQLSPSCRIQGMLRHPEFQHNGNFNSFNFNYKSASHCDDSIEDDRLSQISARSAASSSLASQVLERAQKRKENFWGNK